MSKTAIEIVERFRDLRVLVLGDFLLDEYVFGEISRVSREAPVLILRYQESDYAPGGGANAVAGVAALGATAIPVGYVGEDEWGDRLLSLWPEGVVRDGVLRVAGGRTTRKSRVLAGSVHSFRQQVVRLDYESPAQIDSAHRRHLREALQGLLEQADAFVLSDYALGTVDGPLREHVINRARHLGKPVVVDSRFDPGGFAGATAVTPNISEIEHALGRRVAAAELETVGQRLREKWQLDALLITRGKLGMTLFEPEKIVEIPIYGSDQVVDVTGAGDTVIAVFTTALAAGAGFELAARLANCAGGIVVSKRGTATVSGEELKTAARSI